MGKPENQEAEEQIVIDESETSNEQSEEQFDVEGLSENEVALAKKHGFVKEENKDGEHKEQSVPKTKFETKDKTEEDEVKEDKPAFEKVEEDEKLLENYNKNEKALYWKWKTDKHKRQEAQKEINELKSKLNEAVDSGVSGKKLEKIKALLKNPDSLTIESLQEALDEKIEPEKKDNELDNAQVIQQKVAVKAQFAEKIGASKYDNFEAISNLAKEVILSDSSKTYQKLIDESFLNDDVDENMLVERVVSIARMSPKFNDVVNRVKPEDKEKANRVIENSKKKTSSASVSGASGKRIISESELTVEQATKLSTDQWNKLKPTTRERILRGMNP